jgi:hypothetical protein
LNLNYIILVHQHPKQLKRLVTSLTTANAFFYIHVDKNFDSAPFEKELTNLKNVFFLQEEERRPGIWGDVGIVEATINALNRINNDERDGYCILLSGQDYPIKKRSYIESFFKKNYGTNYITTWRMPYEKWVMSGGMQRLTHYKINLSPKKRDYLLVPSVFDRDFYQRNNLTSVFLLLKLKKIKEVLQLFSRRKLPNKLQPHGGWQWWALPIETIRSILNYLNKNPDYLAFHKYSLLPDEMFFQTIIMSVTSVESKLVIENNLTFLSWESPDAPSPMTLRSPNLEELKSQDSSLFARKFDLEEDETILDLIDAEILKE